MMPESAHYTAPAPPVPESLQTLLERALAYARGAAHAVRDRYITDPVSVATLKSVQALEAALEELGPESGAEVRV